MMSRAIFWHEDVLTSSPASLNVNFPKYLFPLSSDSVQLTAEQGLSLLRTKNRWANMTLCIFSHKLNYCVAKFSNKKKKQFIPMSLLTPVVLCMIGENDHHQQHSNHQSPTLHERGHPPQSCGSHARLCS